MPSRVKAVGKRSVAWTLLGTSRGAVCAAGIIALSLAGCGGSDAKTSVRSPSVTQPPRPERALSRGQNLQEAVYARLRRVDGRASNTEHAALDDAHAQARFAQDRVQVDIYAPDVRPTGRALRIESHNGIKTTLRRDLEPPIAYWSKCQMQGFGRTTIVLRYVDAPVRTVPAVHRALRCNTRRN